MSKKISTVTAVKMSNLPSSYKTSKKSPLAENTWILESATTISPVGPTVTADIKLKTPFFPTYNYTFFELLSKSTVGKILLGIIIFHLHQKHKCNPFHYLLLKYDHNSYQLQYQ